jgi:small GTP-binding protein
MNENYNRRFTMMTNCEPLEIIFKYILIGDLGSGKTSLINRYINDDYVENYICTIGVDFMTKTIRMNADMIKIQIWDTAGMEKYQNITTSYYRSANAGIILFDLSNRDSFNSLDRWIKTFYENINPLNNTCLIIIGNKKDLEDRIPDEEIKQYMSIKKLEYYETSAKTGEGIIDALDCVTNRLYIKYKLTNQQTSSNYIPKRLSLQRVESKTDSSSKCSC